jgi:putative ABC transport system permease protein
METLWQDVRFGIRMLAKNPGFATIAVLTLALGIGANTAIFTVVNAEVLRPLPFPDPSRLVTIWETSSRNGQKSGSVAYPNFIDWRAQNEVFESAAAYQTGTSTLTGSGRAALLPSAMVSAETFSLLGATPEIGRTFLTEEDQAHHHVTIISHRLWKERFKSDPKIVGSTIALDANAYTVVGVMPASFSFPLQRVPVDLWTTFSALDESSDNTPPMSKNRGAHYLKVIARLKPDMSLAQAQAAMDVLANALAKQYPDSNKYSGVRVVAEQEQLTAAVRPALAVMMIAVGFVLLIACANVANLLLARATTRVREIAIRTALGAGRGRVVRQLLTESLILGILAGALGALAAVWGTAALVRLSPENLPRAGEIRMDAWVLAFTMGLSLVTGAVFGLLPALHVTRVSITDSLKEGSQGTTSGTERHRVRSALVVVEMALALVLMASAGLLIRSLARLQDVNPGFDPHSVMASDVDLPDAKYPYAKQGQFSRDLMAKVAALPGVESAGGVFPLPMSGSEMRSSVEIEGRPVAPSEVQHASVRAVTPDYFRTMRIPLVSGRTFTNQDSGEAAPVVIVNQALGQQFFPGENPIGKHIKPGISANGPSRIREIVGVVGNVKFQDLSTEWLPETYIPFSQLPMGSMTIVARTATSPYALAKPIAESVESLDPDLPAYNAKTVEDYLNGTIAAPRFNTFLLAIFAAIALVLTAVGLYGVISYSVAQRTREIGIRMALGARPAQMLRLVVGEGLRLTVTGAGLGLIAGLALTRFLSSMLFGIGPSDPVSFAGVVLLLMAVVVAACYLPARRAMRVDPMVALRYE